MISKLDFIKMRYRDQAEYYNQHIKPNRFFDQTYCYDLNRAIKEGRDIGDKDLMIFALRYKCEILEKQQLVRV